NADIDAAGIDLGGNALIDGTFAGELDGNGHTIYNLSQPLFNQIVNAKISNLTITNSNITSDTYKGALANKIVESEIFNIRVHDTTITNNTNQLGTLAGHIQRSNLDKIAIVNATVTSSNTIGGIAGQIDTSTLQNIIVNGSFTGTLYHTLGSRVGGVAGWLSTDSIIHNCYVNAFVEGVNSVGNGGMIGGPNKGTVNIHNSISLVQGPNSYRISGFPVLTNVENIYELSTSTSLSNYSDDLSDKVKLVDENQVLDPNFYIQELGWSEEVWDFQDVSNGSLPTLR
ncbi:MAG: hypothetical protein MR210_05505, partial [Erysipelotrichaceae bacterium]|nr:hypothetical protein [Erysipelotrichaceae bacterium]